MSCLRYSQEVSRVGEPDFEREVEGMFGPSHAQTTITSFIIDCVSEQVSFVWLTTMTHSDLQVHRHRMSENDQQIRRPLSLFSNSNDFLIRSHCPDSSRHV